MCSATQNPKIDRTKMSVELVFDGANGNVADRVVEDLDWSRVFKLQPDACVLGECSCSICTDVTHAMFAASDDACPHCDELRDEHRDECRSEFLDELAFTSGAFVAIAPTAQGRMSGRDADHAMSVARDAEAEGKSDDEIVACLESEGWQVYKFDLHEGDLFLVPHHWECDDAGAWHPPVDEIVDRMIASGDVEIEIEPEVFDPADHFDNPEDVAFARSGDVWHWCHVEVKVSTGVFGREQSASDYLGGCSCADEAAFRACDYFRDMVHTCVEDLLKRGGFRGMDW